MLSTRKLILIIIGLTVLLVVFFNFALRQIATQSIKVTVDPYGIPSEHLQTQINQMEDLWHVAILDSVTPADNDIQILWVDHAQASAVLHTPDQRQVVEYDAIDPTILQCNQYSAHINGKTTVIINCDEILPDPVTRAVQMIYQQGILGHVDLNAEQAGYYPVIQLDETACYLRREMVDSLYTFLAYDTDLTAFKTYTTAWIDLVGEGKSQAIAQYDYYDGVKEYIQYQILRLRHGEILLMDYLMPYYNIYSIMDPTDEYRVMGLLWCLAREASGEPILLRSGMQRDPYRILLVDVPLAPLDEIDMDDAFLAAIEMMQSERTDFVRRVLAACDRIEPRPLTLQAEDYEHVIRTERGYIYTNYTARLTDGTEIRSDAVLVEIAPYIIRYTFPAY